MTALLETVEVETGVEPRAAVIWMHGLGADGHDFEPIVPELDLEGAPPIRFVFPHAPMRPVTINGGMVMRAWYDVMNAGGVRREDVAGVRASQRDIEALIAREERGGIAAGRIVLAGFSQGGAMTLQTGLRHPERLAGLVVLSSFLPLADALAGEVSHANRDRLLALGYRIEWHEFPMPHSVCGEEIADLSKWLRGVLRPTA